MTQIEYLQDLVEQLAELVEERKEKQEFHEEATEKGEGWEADQIHETIEELNLQIELQKKYLTMKLKEI
jgi:hypothetical protein